MPASRCFDKKRVLFEFPKESAYSHTMLRGPTRVAEHDTTVAVTQNCATNCSTRSADPRGIEFGDGVDSRGTMSIVRASLKLRP